MSVFEEVSDALRHHFFSTNGFRNVGTTTAVVMEIFVKEGASTAAVAKAQTLAATFGSLPRSKPGD